MNDVKTVTNRLKILYLYKILLEKTDNNHYISMPEIISQLSLYGISVARKALYDDIEALKMHTMRSILQYQISVWTEWKV